MIDLKQGCIDYEELRKFVEGVKDLDTLVDLIKDNNEFNITNDLRDRGAIDLNYKSICATIIKENECYLSVDPFIEIWDKNGNLDFVNVNVSILKEYV